MKESYCSSKEITISKVKEADFNELVSLINDLADYEKLDRPDKEAQKRLKEHIFSSKPILDAWLSKVDDKAVGYAITFYTYSSFLALPTLYLEDIFVLPEYRSKGIGKALFNYCAKIALEKGCGRMEWQVLDWNKPAIDFYKKVGAKHMKEWLLYRLTASEIKEFINK